MKRFLVVSFMLAVGGVFLVTAAGVVFVSSVFSQEQQQAQPAQPVQTPVQPAGQVKSPQTLANLMTAYNAEMNAKEKYSAYALKADNEGYKKAAQLFRAAARSEEIHSVIELKSIILLGGAPAVDIKPAAVKTTKENLAEAIESETALVEATYPKYLEQASADNVRLASIAFGNAKPVEMNRKMLFMNALNDLEGWKKASKTGFYVCKICGNLVEALNFAACPICKAPISEFAKIL